MTTFVLHPSASRAAAAPARLLWVLAVHALVLGLLVQRDTVRRVLQVPNPLVVSLIGEPTRTQTPPAAPPRQDPRPRPPPAPAQAPAPAPAPAPTRPAALAAAPEVVVATAPPAPGVVPVPAQQAADASPPAPVLAAAPAPAPPPSPVHLPAPKQVPASAVRYRVPPALEVPMASRRLGEQGTVLLRVWVDVRGVPREVLLHRSSGFARLDEQAILAMRQARFQPLADNGQAIEWVVIAPLQYELD